MKASDKGEVTPNTNNSTFNIQHSTFAIGIQFAAITVSVKKGFLT
jgi:hypothetical protein